MPTCVKPKGVEHPLPTFAFYLLPSAFCLLLASVKPKGDEHPERQKGAEGPPTLWYPGNVDGPMSTGCGIAALPVCVSNARRSIKRAA